SCKSRASRSILLWPVSRLADNDPSDRIPFVQFWVQAGSHVSRRAALAIAILLSRSAIKAGSVAGF
ncbi:MAG: hypothetical protein KGJ00_07245, partial [Bradyrhizobium sp.]|nr:hypothetical protein [Bradyrhizobium sp.]